MTSAQTVSGNNARVRRVLIADDDAEFRGDLKKILKRNGFEVEESGTGAEAVDKAQTQTFDIILLDLVMPGMNGFLTAKNIREKDRAVRIIILTAHAAIDVEAEALHNGANGFIRKPFHLDELMRLIRPE